MRMHRPRKNRASRPGSWFKETRRVPVLGNELVSNVVWDLEPSASLMLAILLLTTQPSPNSHLVGPAREGRVACNARRACRDDGAGRDYLPREARSRSPAQWGTRPTKRCPLVRCFPHPECRRDESSETTTRMARRKAESSLRARRALPPPQSNPIHSSPIHRLDQQHKLGLLASNPLRPNRQIPQRRRHPCARQPVGAGAFAGVDQRVEFTQGRVDAGIALEAQFVFLE